jgi:membrane dipeptidase
MNSKGFDDVARLGVTPLVASHSGCHKLCPHSRNLTDDQLREIARTGGLVGIVFATGFIREDGKPNANTPLSVLISHIQHAVEVAGIGHVALGSDFDGAPMPRSIRSVNQLPALGKALRAAGFTESELEAIAHKNWRRLLDTVWR